MKHRRVKKKNLPKIMQIAYQLQRGDLNPRLSDSRASAFVLCLAFLLSAGDVFRKEKEIGEISVKKKANGSYCPTLKEWQWALNGMPA